MRGFYQEDRDIGLVLTTFFWQGFERASGLRTVGLFRSARSKVFFNDGTKVFEVR